MSDKLDLGLEGCPCCKRTGIHLGVQCLYCDGGRVVTHEKAQKWRDAHRDTDVLMVMVVERHDRLQLRHRSTCNRDCRELGAPARILSSDRIRREHGWTPRIPLSQGLAELCR